jgi:Tfp pilus assembly protein PilE
MAGSKLDAGIKASTIMEVIVSMVIIVIVFGIAMMIFTNVLRVSLSAKKIRAQALLQETLLNAERNPGNTTETFTIDDFRIEQVDAPYQQNSSLTAIHLTAFDQNQQKVADLQKVIINQP